MAGLLERLWALLGDAAAPDPADSLEALAIAYQQRLTSLHEVRTELDGVTAARRRLAVSTGFSDARARASAAARDAGLAAQEAALVQLSTGLRDQLDAFRYERDRIQALPEPADISRQAREALARWQQDASVLLHRAEDSYPEPPGFVSDAAPTEGYEQPPGPGGGSL